jgi:hydroxymethylglutaryl-CoA reductase (NADPH)
MQFIGPVKMISSEISAAESEVMVPLATYESPLWFTTQRGARVSAQCGGIRVLITADHMSRSILLEAPDAQYAYQSLRALSDECPTLKALVTETSRYAQLEDWHTQQIGNLIYIRFAMRTGDAAGHNMVTKASEKLLEWILIQYPLLRYVSISGNLCSDKKVSAINGILGRGKQVIAELTVPDAVCIKYLRSTPYKIVDLHIKKNLLGTLAAGGIRTANAHFANMLLAFYLATGQDGANVVEGSQGIVHAEVRDDGALYFSVTLPNIIVGTVGNGKHLPFVQENLEKLGCLATRPAGANARRLAMIAGATVLCGELSLLAAQTNPGELIHSHLRLERATFKKEVSISC